MTESRLEPAAEVVERALGLARLDGCVVVVEEVSDANVRFANNTTTTNGVRRDRRVTVVAISGEGAEARSGVASASGPIDVAGLVAAAEAEAEEAAPADDAAPLESQTGDPGFSDPPEETDLSVFSSVLSELGGSFERGRAEGRVLSGFAIHEMRTTYLGTSSGARRRYVQPTGSMELVERTVDGSASTWAGKGTPDFADVSLVEMDERLRTRLSWANRTVELPAGRYEVLLPPDAVADLVLELEFAASGREAEDGGSVFSAPDGKTRRGERLTELAFDLFGDPRASGLECVPFVVSTASGPDSSVFDNGLAIEPIRWVEGGTLSRLRYHRAGARRAGVEFSPAPDNLLLTVPDAQASLDELVASTKRGLLLTCLWYIREVERSTLLLTGLTRDGVYLVENGEVVGAVNNYRFNESPVDVLGKTTEAGRTERALSREWHEWANRTAMPALRVADFNMSSVSPAS